MLCVGVFLRNMKTTRATIQFFRSTALMLLVLAAFPAFAQQTEQMASYYYQNHEYDKAVELYETLYSKGHNPYYYRMLFDSYMALDQYKDAASIAEKRINSNPKELAIYVDLGQVHEKQGDLKKAKKDYENAISKIGFDSKQITDLVQAFESNNHLDYAVETYLAARKKMNNPFAYVIELASLHQRMGNYEAMMQEYFNLLDNAPNNINSIQISLQKALNETSNPKLADGLRRTLVSRVQQQPNNKSYLEMMIWFSLQQKDFNFAMTQAKAVDARFPEEGSEQVMRVAQIAHNNQDYTTARQCYQYLIAKGPESTYYFDSRVGELSVRFDQINTSYAIPQAELSKLLKDYHTAFDELGKNPSTLQLMRNYANLLGYHTNNIQEAVDMLYEIVDMKNVSTHIMNEVKLELGDMLLFAGEVWDASLLYSQVEKANKNDVIGAMAKFKNAKLSYYNNDFEWAKSQLDVLRSSTSKLIANDAMELSLLISDNMEDDSTFDMLERYAAADMLIYRNQLDSAWFLLDDITHRALSHPLFDEVLLQKAKISMRKGNYNDADSLLQKIIDFYSTDILADDALWLQAQLNEQQLNNPLKARDCYEKLILDYPASLYVDQARKRYNALKSNS